MSTPLGFIPDAPAPSTAAPAAPEGFIPDKPADFKQTDTSPNEVDPNTLGTFLRHVWAGINPLQIGQLLPLPKALGGSGVDNPLNPAKILEQAEALRQEGNAAWEKGDKTRAVAKYLDSILPILGPIASHAADQLEAGKYAAGAGDITAVVGPAALGAVGRVPSPVKPFGGGWTPAEATANAARMTAPASSTLSAAEVAANKFGDERGVTKDAATETGSPFVRGVQKVAGQSLLGGQAASRGRMAQAADLTRVGQEIAADVHGASVSPEQGGAGVVSSIRAAMADLHKQANTAYDTVRAEEGKPENLDTVDLPKAPVDGLKDWQRAQLRRITHELDASGYVSQNYTHEGDYSPRSGGASVFHDIQEHGGAGLDRGELQAELESYLGGGKETAAVKGALEVAKQRFMGSKKISTPELPASAMDVLTEGEKTRQTSAQMPMAVDLRSLKESVQPIYERLKREGELAPLMGGKAEALRALDRLVNGPDHAPLSVAEAALGDLKTLARSDDPLLRTAGQGVAAKAVAGLAESVNLRAAGAGDTAYDALHAGRKATAAKYDAAKVLEDLRDEPVKVFEQLTAPRDGAIEQLRAVAEKAPEAMPAIGRAKLEQWLDLASESGHFDHADKLYSEWERLGPETKKILFGKASTVQALDNFFLLAKRIAKNPNPSGTAPTLVNTGEIAGVTSALASGHGMAALGSIATSATLGGLAKLMYSPKGIRAITRLLELDSKAAVQGAGRAAGRAASQAAWLDLANAAKAEGISLPAKVASSQDDPR